jgi:hypothetical protein
MVLAVLLLLLWYLVDSEGVRWPGPALSGWLLAGGLAALMYTSFNLLSSHWAWVQAYHDHIRLRTPIYRLNISYRRVLNIRPVAFSKIFPPSEWGPSDRRLLEPYRGATALSVDLHGWPLHPILLRLFFSRYFFSPETTGIVLLVEDWMDLSNTIHAGLQAWREPRRSRPSSHGSEAARILQGEDPDSR